MNLNDCGSGFVIGSSIKKVLVLPLRHRGLFISSRG